MALSIKQDRAYIACSIMELPDDVNVDRFRSVWQMVLMHRLEGGSGSKGLSGSRSKCNIWARNATWTLWPYHGSRDLKVDICLDNASCNI